MALETGLKTLLLAEPTITSLVPSQTMRGNTFRGVFNEKPIRGFAVPYILISLIDFDPYVCLDGTSGLASYEIDIDCYADDYASALSMASAVSEFLKDYTGAAGPDDIIEAVIWQSKRHDMIQEGEGRDVQHHIIGQSFQIQAR